MSDDLMLAIETSSLRGSVALGREGRAGGWRALSADRKHAAELLPAIHELLTETRCGARDVKCICFSHGPGSFTGLRVAATIARLWQSVVGCEVVAAPSLEVIARNALSHPQQPARLAVMLDARRGQVFGGVFERADEHELRTVVEPALRDAEPWLAKIEQPCWALGDGVTPHRDALRKAGLVEFEESYWTPDARQTLAVGWRRAQAGSFCKPEQIVPAYLRPPECEEVYEQRRAEARKRRGE